LFEIEIQLSTQMSSVEFAFESIRAPSTGNGSFKLLNALLVPQIAVSALLVRMLYCSSQSHEAPLFDGGLRFLDPSRDHCFHVHVCES
jgi:hypothetical protein